MGRLDTSRVGQLRLLAERLRRRALDMTLPNYIELMERAATELDCEAQQLEAGDPDMGRPGSHLNIVV